MSNAFRQEEKGGHKASERQENATVVRVEIKNELSLAKQERVRQFRREMLTLL